MKSTILKAALVLAIVGSVPLAAAQTPAVVAPTAVVTTPAIVTPPTSTEAATALTEVDIRALLAAKNFTDINDVKFKEGTWTADAKSADGNHVEVKIDAATGEIYPDEPIATIGKDQIIINVQAAGYTNVHDVEMEAGVWKAEANDSKGNDVELKLDPNDGHVIGSKEDVIGAKH